MKKDSKPSQAENQENSENILDENPRAAHDPNEPASDDSELEKMRTELEEQKEKYLRKAAEFDNYIRRTQKEKNELRQTAGKEVISELLDILDDADRAQKLIENSGDQQAVKEGVLLIFSKLRNKMQLRGLKAMESIHQEFNPDLHEAIGEIPAPSDDLKGKIIDEVMKGYYLNDKLIRHAKVIVGK